MGIHDFESTIAASPTVLRLTDQSTSSSDRGSKTNKKAMTEVNLFVTPPCRAPETLLPELYRIAQRVKLQVELWLSHLLAPSTSGKSGR